MGRWQNAYAREELSCGRVESTDTAVLGFLVISLGVSFYMAFNIGANDLANAMGTSVGSRALTVKRAIIVAAILNFFGAVLVGSRVTETVRKNIIDMDMLGGGKTLSWIIMFGMLAAMLAAAIWVTIATYFSLPVSTTHSIVGAMMGFGLAAGGIAVVNWPVVGRIALSWVISPIAGVIVAFFCFMLMRKLILAHERPFMQTIIYAPLLVGLVFGILAIAMVLEGLGNLHLGLSYHRVLAIGVTVGALAAIPSRWLFKKFEKMEGDEYEKVERVFCPLQVCTAGYVAFAAGSNDVANAIAPLSGIVGQLVYGSPTDITSQAMVGLLILGGIGIAFGIVIWGKGVMRTIGERITDITPTRGFTAEFAAASTVLLCSLLALPISTTHVLVGAVIGVGLAGGVAAVDARVIKDIVISWVVTVPVAALLCMSIYLGISYIA